MDAQEAQRLSQDKRVKSVEQDVLFSFATAQTNAGWGLDRIDQPTTALNNTYNYINTGTGRTVYVLDSGLALANANVANTEFGGRASIYYDFTYNGGALCGPVSIGATGYCGEDTLGHGTQVASIAGGSVAKGTTIKMIKVGNDFPYNNWLSNATTSLNWLAANAPRGTIVNMSLVLHDNFCNTLPAQLEFNQLGKALS